MLNCKICSSNQFITIVIDGWLTRYECLNCRSRTEGSKDELQKLKEQASASNT